MTRAGWQPNKQTSMQNQRHRNWQTFRQKNIPKEQNRCTS